MSLVPGGYPAVACGMCTREVFRLPCRWLSWLFRRA